MTLKEAAEVARKCMPVMYDGSMYLRIAAYGVKVNEKGEEFPFLTLKDRHRNSTIDVRPDEVAVVGGR